MAVGCLGGTIENTSVDEIIVDGRSCYINNVNVTGNIVVTNSEELIMVRNNVVGNIRVLGGRDATLVANTSESNIVVSRNEKALLVLNVAAQTIRVNGNVRKATVKRNGAGLLILCRNNGRLDAFENEAPDVECRALGGGFGPNGLGGF
jgi:hypothetical protein